MECQVSLKSVAACRNRLLQSIADLHPSQLLINRPRLLSLGPTFPRFQSYLHLQSQVFLCGPGSFASTGVVQKLGTVLYQMNTPSWNLHTVADWDSDKAIEMS